MAAQETERPRELDRGWRLIESQHPAGESRLIAEPLDFELPHGALMVGVDAVGTRHLLIPVDAGEQCPERIVGKWVRLARRDLVVDGVTRAFVDLSCSKPDLYDEFAILAGRIVDEVAAEPKDAISVALHVIADWRELLRTEARGGLTREEVIGLYSELFVLEQLVHLDPRRRVDSWTGPDGARHDFQRGSTVIEVKGSTARRGRPVVIHGVDQLEPPPDTTLYLLWMRLEVGIDRGDSLSAIVDRLHAVVRDREDFMRRLHKVGYGADPDADHSTPLFTMLESRLYVVEEPFPRITRASFVNRDVPGGVRALVYEIDLAGDQPDPLPEELAQSILAEVAKL